MSELMTRRKFTKRVISVAVGGMALSTFGGIQLSQAQPSKRSTKVALQLSAFSIGHVQALNMARKKGFFEEEGLECKYGEYDSGARVVLAMPTGDVEFGQVGLFPILMGKAQGVDMRIICSANLEGSIIIGAPHIKTIEELNKKRVATLGPASIQEALLGMAEEKYGFKCVHLSMKGTDMPIYLGKGEIDAYVTGEVMAFLGMARTGGHILMSSKDIRPNHECCAIVSPASLVKKEPDVVLRFLRAHEKGAKYALAHPEEVVSLISEKAELEPSIAKDALKYVKFRYPGFVSRDDIKWGLDYFLRIKQIEPKQVPDKDKFIAELYDESFLKKVHTS